MRIEYMFIGKTADERTPQKKDINEKGTLKYKGAKIISFK